MEPAVWGPDVWRVLFAASFELPTETSVELFLAIRHLVPCPHCRRHYVSHCRRVPPDAIRTDTPLAAAKWLWTIRDMVNQNVGARSVPFKHVEGRARVFEGTVAPLTVLDAAALFSLQLEGDEACRAFATAFRCLARLVAITSPRDAACLAPVADEHLSPATAWLHVLACKNALLQAMGRPLQTREEWLAQYERCRAAPPPTSAGGDSTRASRRRRGDSTRARR